MIDDLLPLLACPHCAAPLSPIDAAVGCPQGHRFDRARQGYLNLLPGPPPRHADTVAMVAARLRFLGSGAYDPIVDVLAEQLAGASVGTIVDAGAGPGWYLAQVLDRQPAARGLALDVSVPAVRRAARCHRRAGAIVADTWGRLPIVDHAADLALSIFAPRNPAEFARVLAPGGHAVIIAAEPDHLAGLRSALGLLDIEPDKDGRLRAALQEHLAIIGSERVTFEAPLNPDQVADLVAMGPNAFHATAGSGPVAAAQVRIAVRITITRPR